MLVISSLIPLWLENIVYGISTLLTYRHFSDSEYSHFCLMLCVFLKGMCILLLFIRMLFVCQIQFVHVLHILSDLHWAVQLPKSCWSIQVQLWVCLILVSFLSVFTHCFEALILSVHTLRSVTFSWWINWFIIRNRPLYLKYFLSWSLFSVLM